MTDGVLYAYELDGVGGARPIGLDEAAARPAGAKPVWVHMDYTTDTCTDWIENQCGASALIAEALLAEDTRPRVMLIDGGILVALRGVNLNPGTDPEDMVSIRVWIDGHRVISTQWRRLLSAEQLAEDLDVGKGPTTIGGFLVELVERLTVRIGEVADDLEDKVFELEEALVSGEPEGLRDAISSLRRRVIALRRYMAPQREALARLHVESLDWMSAAERLAVHEVGDDLTRYIENLDAVRERAAIAQEELLSRLSEQANRRMYALSVVAGVFLPLGFLTGLLGINVGGIPGADEPQAFWLFVGLLVGLVAVQLWLYRRWKWL